jgi:hypothetical protein
MFIFVELLSASYMPITLRVRNIRKLLLTVYCFSLFVCCQQKNGKQHDLFIECLIKEEFQNNSLYQDIIVFCKINDNDKLGYLNTGRLRILFNHDSLYLKMGYHKFIEGVVRQKIVLDKKEVEGNFVPNDRIISKCNKEPFSDFLTTYTECMNENEYSVKNYLSFNEKMTVLYCLYQYDYYSGFDDVIGLYFSEKIDLILQRAVERIEIELQ